MKRSQRVAKSRPFKQILILTLSITIPITAIVIASNISNKEDVNPSESRANTPVLSLQKVADITGDRALGMTEVQGVLIAFAHVIDDTVHGVDAKCATRTNFKKTVDGVEWSPEIATGYYECIGSPVEWRGHMATTRNPGNAIDVFDVGQLRRTTTVDIPYTWDGSLQYANSGRLYGTVGSTLYGAENDDDKTLIAINPSSGTSEVLHDFGDNNSIWGEGVILNNVLITDSYIWGQPGTGKLLLHNLGNQPPAQIPGLPADFADGSYATNGIDTVYATQGVTERPGGVVSLRVGNGGAGYNNDFKDINDATVPGVLGNKLLIGGNSLYLCDLETNGVIKVCSDQTAQMPADLGEIKSIVPFKDSLYILGTSISPGQSVVYKYTPTTQAGTGNADDQPPPAEPTPVPTTAPQPTETPAPTPEPTVPTCAEYPDIQVSPDKIRKRVSCNFSPEEGVIDEESCTQNESKELNNAYADLETLNIDNQTIIQTYLTDIIDGVQLRCNRICDFTEDEGRINNCLERNDRFTCRSVSSINNACGDKFQSHTSFFVGDQDKRYIVMVYIYTNMTDGLMRVCPVNKENGEVTDFNRCQNTPFDLTNIRGQGNEKYISNTQFTFNNEEKLYQIFTNKEYTRFGRVCDLGYSYGATNDLLTPTFDNCTEFQEINIPGVDEKFLGTVEPYTRSDGQVRISFFAI